jgi:hypothetical protein
VFVHRPIEHVNNLTTVYSSGIEGGHDFPCHFGSRFNDGILGASGQLDAHIITSLCPCLKPFVFSLMTQSMTSETKSVIECVDVPHSYVRPDHGSAILTGHSAESLAILSVFEQCIHAFSNGIRIVELTFHRRTISYHFFSSEKGCCNNRFFCAHSI